MIIMISIMISISTFIIMIITCLLCIILCVLVCLLLRPVSITKFPLSRFSPGAGLLRNPFVYTINAEIFQGLGPKRRESSNGDRAYYGHYDYADYGYCDYTCKLMVLWYAIIKVTLTRIMVTLMVLWYYHY